ncbi:hypothetical protein [Planktothrix mougeotii]|uniref:Uncharacterized protein n=1 Tax=Planktothrix mougeotii LEGE 06226 TaxID=1828728 RepID=A0ABR9UB32_9CYAN|nr:hypothetical protein [Planktothrix mougeotii]MBE9143672.1 hypothetical protein [Planktothrix mougeotii LEGE 06226]
MESIQFKGHIGQDGILRVQMPAEFKDRDLEGIVCFQVSDETLKHEDWQPGFFEEVIGGWVGEPLVRENQGQYEMRENLF